MTGSNYVVVLRDMGKERGLARNLDWNNEIGQEGGIEKKRRLERKLPHWEFLRGMHLSSSSKNGVFEI